MMTNWKDVQIGILKISLIFGTDLVILYTHRGLIVQSHKYFISKQSESIKYMKKSLLWSKIAIFNFGKCLHQSRNINVIMCVRVHVVCIYLVIIERWFYCERNSINLCNVYALRLLQVNIQHVKAKHRINCSWQTLWILLKIQYRIYEFWWIFINNDRLNSIQPKAKLMECFRRCDCV